MSLNIKDPEAHRLATAIAQETGETMTRVVTEALRERFERTAEPPGQGQRRGTPRNCQARRRPCQPPIPGPCGLPVR